MRKMRYAIKLLKRIDPLERKLNYLSIMAQNSMPESISIEPNTVKSLLGVDIHGLSCNISRNDLMFKHQLLHTNSFISGVRNYFISGMQASQMIANILNEKEKFSLIESMRNGEGKFLDFASGFGRVSRFLEKDYPNNVHTCDVKSEAVDWISKEIGCTGIYLKDFFQSTEQYTVIYAGSLFSHLPSEMFEKYLLKLISSLEPGGVLIFSTHGPRVKRFKKKLDFEFVELSEDLIFTEVEDHISAVDQYGSTYVDRKYVDLLVEKASSNRCNFYPNLLGGNQDVYVFER
jgi:SAM-dependent methyltransferase